MQCLECRQENRAQASFCDQCGAALPRKCEGCGQINRPKAKFCDECGSSVVASSDRSASASAPEVSTTDNEPTPHTYTPRYISENILTTRSALEGERKVVTVLFADIANSSAFAQQLDAETLHSLLDRVLQLAAHAVHRYDGTVNSYLGDGMMALFGAPIALEDHALRAVHAALTIQETIRGLNAEIQRELGISVRLRIALNTGSVVVGRIGDNLRMDYTANSNTVHQASRLQSVAEPGSILITEDTYRAITNEITAELVGPVEVRGQREPLVVYRVAGRTPRSSRREFQPDQGLTKFVGRNCELAQLHDRLARAEAGQGQAVAIVGEPGLGKSRLLYELHRSLGADRMIWLEGHCRARGLTLPYGPVIEVLRSIFYIEDDDNPLQTAEKLEAGVGRLGLSRSEALPFLNFVFDLPETDEALRHVEAKDKRLRTQQALAAAISAAAQQRPLVLVFENLHWRDQSTEDFIAFYAAGLQDVPVLMVTTHRPGYDPPWTNIPSYCQFALDRLSDEEIEQMAASLLGGHSVADDLLRFIGEKADGIPLFVEEVTRALAERNFLIHQPARLRLASAAEIELPPTMQGIIQARIDALGEAVKQTVQIAAVIGREFDLRLLTAASDTPNEVPQHLEALKRIELIHELRVLPRLEYQFKHAVIRGVAYRSLLGPRRQALHGAIARSMEELGREHQAAVLAHHFAQSEQQEKAIGYGLAAGDQAARLYANAEASDYYDQALTLAKSLPPSPELQRARIDATIKRATVGTTRKALEADERNLEEARELALALGDEPRMASVLYWLGRLAYVRGMFEPAAQYAEQSLAIADRLGDEALAAPPVNLMGRYYYLTGEYSRASNLLARSVEQMHNLGNPTEEATAAGFAGVAFGALGEFERALSYADRGLTLAQELKNPFVEAAAYNYRAVAHCYQGSAAAAVADCEATKQIATKVGDRFRIYLAQFYEGQAWAMAGDPLRAREVLEDSIGLAKELGTTTLLAWGEALLAETLLAIGEAEAAEPLCRKAIRLAERSRDKLANALAHRTLAGVLTVSEPSNIVGAETAIQEAMRIQREVGCEPELGRSHLAYARLLVGWGRDGEASEQLRRAIGIFRQRGMVADEARAEDAIRALPPIEADAAK